MRREEWPHLLPSGVRKSSTEVFSHIHLFPPQWDTVKKQERSLGINTGNHTLWLYVAKDVLVFALPHAHFLFSDVCSLYMQADVYISQGSQLKASPWLYTIEVHNVTYPEYTVSTYCT